MKSELSLDDICTLISGEIETEIFCCSLSVGAKAFYGFGEKALKPDIILAINDFEYDGEEIMEFNGIRYAITRTYDRKDGLIELTGTRKAGLQRGNH